MSENTNDAEPGGRTARQYLTYLGPVLAFLVLPFPVAALLSPDAATIVTLVSLPLIALGLGLVDGAVFRFNLSFPLISAAIFWQATRMFYNSGTWVYVLGALILLVVGQWLGARIRPEKPTTKDSPAVENSEEGAR
ncbi:MULTISPECIES: hypothetical protein [Corynebacterium]|uniref:hypothetical protein n=1 Tax=Corynebacterium TaxID=1716 RepID=UPI0025804412|nr:MULTISPECIES: hypothetical protein [Corynebacterium]